MHADATSRVSAIILAGGRGQRLGGADKGLLLLNGMPLVTHVISAIQPQVAKILIVANRNIEHYARLGHPVFSDQMPDYAGPLAGITAGLVHVTTPYAIVCACDMPRLPPHLVARMYQAVRKQNTDICVLRDRVGLQPFPMLIARTMLSGIISVLEEQQAKVMTWLERQPCSTLEEDDTLININTPAALTQASDQ